jgi:hypothetical protein
MSLTAFSRENDARSLISRSGEFHQKKRKIMKKSLEEIKKAIRKLGHHGNWHIQIL